MGLVVANAAAQAYEYIGLPEGIFDHRSHTLPSDRPKINSALAFQCTQGIEEHGAGSVPVT